MWTVYAVYTNKSKNYLDDVEKSDFTCFWEDEEQAAEAMAEEYDTDVNEWTMLYGFELDECSWRTEEQLAKYASGTVCKPAIT